MISLQSAVPSFVAHFDMLGMKNIILRDTNAAWDSLCKLFDAREYVLGLPFHLAKNDAPLRSRVRHFAFSDTIVLYTVGDAEADLYAIIVFSAELFLKALAACVPLRGAIAHGGFITDEVMKLFTGPALVEAYALGEEAQWLGISIQSEVAQRAAAVPMTHGRALPVVIEHAVPLTGGKTVLRHAVDWPSIFRSSFAVEVPISAELFFSPFEPLFGTWEQLPVSARAKYENTVSFINERLAVHEPAA